MWLVGTCSVSGNLPFCLDPGEYVVGRSSKADVVIRSPSISGKHARLLRRGDEILVQDIGSRHGIFVNGELAKESAVGVGARIQFGSILCLVTPVALYPARAPGRGDGLTPAQREVLRLILQGLDEQEIAERLQRSGHTVHTHVKALFKRFDVHSRAELLVKLLAGK